MASQLFGWACSLLLMLLGAWAFWFWIRARRSTAMAEKAASMLSTAGIFSTETAPRFVHRLWMTGAGLVLQGVATTGYVLDRYVLSLGNLGDAAFVPLLLFGCTLGAFGVILPALEGTIARWRRGHGRQ